MPPLLFARVGWMKWYRGPQPDDEKPVGGGSYNKESLGHEAFNFRPLGGYMLGYFQPRLRADYASSIALERIVSDSGGRTELGGVLAVFVATDPKGGGQRVVGWFRDATVYRHERTSNDRRRNSFSYYLKTPAASAVLVPEEKRWFTIPQGKGAFGQANVCYPLDIAGKPKQARWMEDAVEYIDSYALENVAHDPESEADSDIERTLGSTIERVAGFQSNPQIRRAIEEYAMRWAERRLTDMGYRPTDTHKNKPYDFVCKVKGADLYIEVKGTQDDGRSVSLSPNEVQHARDHRNRALFIVHSVKVKGKRHPKVSGGTERFLHPWDITKGTLKPRGFVFTLVQDD